MLCRGKQKPNIIYYIDQQINEELEMQINKLILLLR
jgi:hypothetical protein